MSRKGENIYKRKDGRWEGRFRKIQRRKRQDQIRLCLCQKLHRGTKSKISNGQKGMPIFTGDRHC